jgi:hypothetical protein
MTRAITAVLTKEMRSQLKQNWFSLKRILSSFWGGTVQWTAAAHRQLMFWVNVCFKNLRAHISSDVLRKLADNFVHYPELADHTTVSFLFQDASATASGGGVLRWSGGAFKPMGHVFLAEFTELEREMSSTLRELLGILDCLKACADATFYRVIVFCDNWQSVEAIKVGSRNPRVQAVAEHIFYWCLRHGKLCWPVWLPRTHALIKEADRRSRLAVPHDQRSPAAVVATANSLAISLWGRPISFDRAASHRSAVKLNGRRLPFNSYYAQPGSAGVDMFMQHVSWARHVNYVYPPAPAMGRLATFLPSTRARSIVVCPLPMPVAWWSFAMSSKAAGVVASVEAHGFRVTAFDFVRQTDTPNNYHPSRQPLISIVTLTHMSSTWQVRSQPVKRH